MGKGLEASDGNDLLSLTYGANQNDALWTDAVTGGSATGAASDWTRAAAAGHADAQREPDQWIVAGERSTGDQVLFEDGPALTSVDGLPW